MKTFCAVSIASLLRCQVASAFVTTPPPPFSGGASPSAQCQQSSRHDPLRLPVLRGSFFDDLFGTNEGNSNAEEKPATTDNMKEDSKATADEMKEDIANDDDVWDASGLAAEIERRNTGSNDEGSEGEEPADSGEEEEAEFDGYALRDAILNKFGVCWDVDFQRVESYGFRKVYLNVLPFKLGSRRFRHQSEWDYLCHLQAIVEILQKYDLLDSVLVQLEETKKKPRPGTSPLVAVPLRLDLTEEQIDQILGPRR